MIAIPFLGNYLLTGGDSGVLSTENRKPAKFPELEQFTQHGIKDFFTGFGVFVSDRLIGRDFIVSMVNKWILGEDRYLSSDYSKGVVGKDGYLFLGEKYENVISRHLGGAEALSQHRQSSCLQIHKHLQQVALSVNSKYFVFVAPDKHGVYCDKLPNWLSDNGNGCAETNKLTQELLTKFAVEKINVIYPFDVFNVRREENLYYLTDTHWNLKGAEVGFKYFMDKLNVLKGDNLTFRMFKNYQLKREEVKGRGDLINILGLPAEDVFRVDFEYKFFANNLTVTWGELGGQATVTPILQAKAKGQNRNWFGESHNNEAPNHLKVVVICDSFMTAMSLFFNLNFQNVYYISRHADHANLETVIQNVKPDFVVYEQVERSFW